MGAAVGEIPVVVAVEVQRGGDAVGEADFWFPAEYALGLAEVTLEATDVDLGVFGWPGDERHVAASTGRSDGEVSNVEQTQCLRVTQVENLTDCVGAEHGQTHG